MGFAIQHGFRLGSLEVYPDHGEVLGSEGPIELDREAFRVLVALAEKFPGEVAAQDLLHILAESGDKQQTEPAERLARIIEELSSSLCTEIPASELIHESDAGYCLKVPVQPLDAVSDYAAGYDPYYADDDLIPAEDFVENKPPPIPKSTAKRKPAAEARASANRSSGLPSGPGHLRIFVSSPGDVRQERRIVRDVLGRLQDEIEGVATLEPIFWEEEPLLATDTFQTQILRPSDCDIMVAILWSRLGTPLPVDITRPDGTRYESGTEFEFEDAVRGFQESGRPRLLLYRKTVPASVTLDDEKGLLQRVEQKKKLDAFIDHWFRNAEDGTLTGAFHNFETTAEFEYLIEGHLRKIIHRLLPETAGCGAKAHGKEDPEDAGPVSKAVRDLSERRVFRVLFGYPVFAWIVLQVADVLANFIGMEARDFQPLLAVLIGGYPLAIFLSWLLQKTDRGLIIHPSHRDSQGQVIPLRPLIGGLSAAAVALAVGIGAYSFLKRSLVADCDRTIAVLPFDNFSPSEADAYLGKGFAEEMLHKLAQIDEMKVASRTASFNLKTADMDVEDIGRRLGVCHLLEGSVRRQDDMLRITAQLIDVRSNYHLWSRTYDRAMADLFSVYDEIAAAITENLRISLGESTAPKPEVMVTNLDAYDSYLQARSILERADDESRVMRADKLFERALEHDPDYARALAGRCETNTLMYEFSRSVHWVTAAEQFCRQALAADDSLGDVRVALARLYSLAGRQDEALDELAMARKSDADNPDLWRTLGQVYEAKGANEKAEAAFQRAIEIASWDVRPYQELGEFYFHAGRYQDAEKMYAAMVKKSDGSAAAYTGLGAILTIQGKFEEAAAAHRKAIQKDPNSRTYTNAGSAYFYQGRFEEAALMNQEAVALAPEDFRLVGNLADAVRFLPGRAEEARELYQRALDLSEIALEVNPEDLNVIVLLPHFYAQMGRSREARDAIEKSVALGPDYYYVYYYAGLAWLELGERDMALEAFRKAAELGFPLTLLVADPQLEDISSSTEFQAIAREYGETP